MSKPKEIKPIDGFANVADADVVSRAANIQTQMTNNANFPNPPADLAALKTAIGTSTSVVLVNPTDDAISGSVQFRDPSGSPTTLTAGGQSNNTFAHAIPGRSSFNLQTSGSGAATASGSVSVVPGANTPAPVGLAVFSYKPADVTVSQAGVPYIKFVNFSRFREVILAI
jgi:hypothetical protein